MLLFDEPFGALDTQTRVHLRREIRALLKKVNVPSIFITHDQEEALELGDRVAVLNVGHIEQIGTPFEIYNHPATEYVATFLGAANVLDAVVRKDYLEVGSAQIPATLDKEKFKPGDCVKIVFRPEDVSLNRGDLPRSGHPRLGTARIEEIAFVGAYERLRLRLEVGGAEECKTDETPYYLTTETPESQSTKSIIATRPKPEASCHAIARRRACGGGTHIIHSLAATENQGRKLRRDRSSLALLFVCAEWPRVGAVSYSIANRQSTMD